MKKSCMTTCWEMLIRRLKKRGWTKVQHACDQARRDEFLYIWIDTLCIDKAAARNSLNAINSMFAWYKGARRYYAYLSDVTAGVSPETSDEFALGKWFTLQELVAPIDLAFFAPSKDGWSELRKKPKLCRRLSEITKID